MAELLQLEMLIRMLLGIIMFSFAAIVILIIIVAWTISFIKVTKERES